jgi:hypothetical protein
MVAFKTIAAALALNILSAAAAPTTSPVTARENPHILAQASIYMCKDTRWNGECRNVLVNLDSCSKLRRPTTSLIILIHTMKRTCQVAGTM